MIKLASAGSESFHNFRCGEVYCLSKTRYDITCCLCGVKVELLQFPRHFREKHLTIDGLQKDQELSQFPTTQSKERTGTENDPLLTEQLIEIKPELIEDEEEFSAFSWNDNTDDHDFPIDVNNVDTKPDESNATKDIGDLGAKTEPYHGQDLDEIKIGIENDEWLHEKYSYVDVPSEDGDDDVDIEGIAINCRKENISDSDNENSDDGNTDEKESFNIPKKKKTTIPTDYIVEAVRCEDCNRLFNSRIALKIHMSMAHDRKVAPASKVKTKPKPPPEYPCDQCEEKFSTERALVSHKYKHTGIICKICGKTFQKIANLNYHQIRHSGAKTIHCKECDMSFFTEPELKAHMIRHTGNMKHICEICGKRCRDHGVLTAHMRRHTGERPAKCNVCGKSFFSGYDLNVHSVTHTTERPFKCDICGSTFQLKKSLRVHKKIHSKDRNHTCKICGKSFAQSSGLHSHMRMHDTAPSNDVGKKFRTTNENTDNITDIIVHVPNALEEVPLENVESQWSLSIL